jgi:NhaB family Na+:H+ antiporter
LRLLTTAAASFLGKAPRWYVQTTVAILVLNVPLYLLAGPVITAWVIVLEFIFTLAMALKCYPLAPGGLIAIEAILLNLTSTQRVYEETVHGLPVILLLLYMVSAIYFMRELLLYLFSRVLTLVRSQTVLAFLFCLVSAVLSAFLDALTVLAVTITVAVGFYSLYLRVVTGMAVREEHLEREHIIPPERKPELEEFRAALRGLMMHAAVGTALGGVLTLVGEPQNLLIGSRMGWDFVEFFRHCAPVSLPVFAAGLLTCVVVDRFKLFSFGTPIPPAVRDMLLEFERHEAENRTSRDKWRLIVQTVGAVLLVAALALHVAEVGLIGLALVILLVSFIGISEEHALAEGFKAALPFTALLVVFFAIVAMIHDQHLFKPVIEWVLARDATTQPAWLFLANGVLSAMSDNVFVATIYISEVENAFRQQLISADQLHLLAVAINTGTNIPSVATPNGQAAFLFLLTSAVAPLIRLSYGRMVWMALPYFVVMTAVGLLAVMNLRAPDAQGREISVSKIETAWPMIHTPSITPSTISSSISTYPGR